MSREKDTYNSIFADYIIRGMILLFPIMMFRENYLNGFSEQDVYFYIITLLIGVISIWNTLKKRRPISNAITPDLWLLGSLFALSLVFLMIQIILGDDSCFRSAHYAGALLLILAVRSSGLRNRYYLKLFAFPTAVIYGFLVYYGATGSDTILGVEALTQDASLISPLLILCAASSGLLLMTSHDLMNRILYSLLTVLGFVLICIFGDALAICLLILFLLFLPLYLNLPGRISRFCDRFPIIYVIYRYLFVSLCFLALSTFLYGDRIAALPDNWGLGILKPLSGSIYASVHECQGEWLYVVGQFGVPGVLILCAALSGMLYCIRKAAARIDAAVKTPDHEQSDDPAEDRKRIRKKGYIISDNDHIWFALGGLFLVQSLFYPLSVVSMPLYLIAMGFIFQPEKTADEVEFISLEDTARDRTREADNGKGGSSAFGRFKPVLLATTAGICCAFLGVLVAITVIRWGSSFTESSGDGNMHMIAREYDTTAQTADSVDAQPVSGDAAMAGDDIDETATATASDAFGEAGIFDVGAMGADGDSIAYDINDPALFGLDDISDLDLMGNVFSDADANAEQEQTHNSISNGDYHIYDPDASYKECNNIVTAKAGTTRLRSLPSIGEAGAVIHNLSERERAVCVGIGDNGWSKIDYRGTECYAVTEFLKDLGAYHGKASELATVPAEEPEINQTQATSEPENTQSQGAESAQNSKKKQTGPVGYTLMWSNDNRTGTIWSSGVRQGTLSVSDGEAAQSINVYADYYSGKKKYLSISVPAGENPLSLQADSGFMTALKNMGYSGVYFNKQVMDW